MPSPAGERFTQATAHELAGEDRLVFACGRYEGIDERVMEWAAEHFTVRPMSLGDYVLNGGEVAVLAMVEAIGRLLPGVVGNPESLVEESHSDGLLEYPVYTKPSSWRDRDVPAVLLSGNHGKIAQWRRHEQYRRTAERRPDLLEEFDAGKLPRADRTAFADLGYDVVDGRLRAPRRRRRGFRLTGLAGKPRDVAKLVLVPAGCEPATGGASPTARHPGPVKS